VAVAPGDGGDGGVVVATAVPVPATVPDAVAVEVAGDGLSGVFVFVAVAGGVWVRVGVRVGVGEAIGDALGLGLGLGDGVGRGVTVAVGLGARVEVAVGDPGVAVGVGTLESASRPASRTAAPAPTPMAVRMIPITMASVEPLMPPCSARAAPRRTRAVGWRRICGGRPGGAATGAVCCIPPLGMRRSAAPNEAASG